MTAEGWRPLGTRQPAALLDARLQLHHAAQLAVGAATELLSGPVAAQRRRLEGFLSESIAASRASLGSSRA